MVNEAIDPFAGLAPFYDEMMAHVDYERWTTVSAALANLASKPRIHVDVACGTATLVKALRKQGIVSFGVDRSWRMLAGEKRGRARGLTSVADMGALPFRGQVAYITSLFDSINFLLTVDELETCMMEFARALRPGGLLYIDAITERMVLNHFAGRKWNEQNGRFSTSWESSYDRAAHVATTRIRVQHRPECVLQERVFTEEHLVAALDKAGFALTGMFDATRWTHPTRRTERIDMVAFKGAPSAETKDIDRTIKSVRLYLRDRVFPSHT